MGSGCGGDPLTAAWLLLVPVLEEESMVPCAVRRSTNIIRSARASVPMMGICERRVGYFQR